MRIQSLVMLIFCISSCATFSNSELTQAQQSRVNKIVEAAYQLEGKKTLVVNEKKFNSDCTGAIAAVYHNAGIDLYKYIQKYKGNGVTRLYNLLSDYKLLHFSSFPRVGDIIFWDNTYDKNNDKIENDELTHTGIVISVSRNGDIKYAHYHYTKGFTIESMNLLFPDIYTKEINGKVVVINSPMRAKSAPKSKNWLASHLCRKFGMGYFLPDLVD
ncbi:MAG: CHAP domain-containing protein [Spirochaetales bacterium]|nr:CHAP domain-containing protein [Spirochaetales bacterium]